MHNKALFEMRNKKVLKNTMNSQVYNKALKANLGCPLCPANKGCNKSRDNDHMGWKFWRKTKWKNKD